MADSATNAPTIVANNRGNNNRNANNNNTNKNQKPKEHNPRWKGYVYILLASLVNFSSVSNLELENNPSFRGMWQVSLIFGLVTFVATVLILLLDRFQYCCSDDASDRCNFTKAMDGRFEGYTLVAFTIWWIIGVSQITRVGGVAYSANNIYFSSWLNLVACIYTLDQWSAAKDIISIHELTGVSATLKSWYLLFLSSLVVMGTSADMNVQVSDLYKSDCTYGVVFGLFSTLASLFWILVHYRLVDFECLQVGGWIELSSSFLLILLWIVGVSVLTQEGGIAATIGGSGCRDRRSEDLDVDFGDGCYVVWVDPDEHRASASPSEEPTVAPGTDTDTTMPSLRPSMMPSSTPTSGSSDPPPLPDNETSAEGDDAIPSLPDNGTDTEGDDAILDNTTLIGSDDFDASDIENNDTMATTENENSPAADAAFLNDEFTRRVQETNQSEAPSSFPASSNATISPAPSSSTSFRPSDMPSLSPTTMPSFLPSAAPSMEDPGVECKAILQNQLPGSNLYFSVWLCFFAAFNVTLRWKAAQALTFAKAQNRRAAEQLETPEADQNNSENIADDNDDDDDDDLDDDDI